MPPRPPATMIAACRTATLLAAAVLAGCSGGQDAGSLPAPAGGDAPTVLLVSIDTLRADRVGCYGRADAGTPAMDGLAAEGVRFANAQTSTPITLPAHASLLTGRSLPAHGVFNNGTFALPAEVPTVGESFTRAGYATGAFVSAPVLARRYGLARGFSIYDDKVPPSRTRFIDGGERRGRDTADAALRWLAEAGRGPAFLWVHFFEPHHPYNPPREHARPGGDAYQGEVATADAALGQLLAGIARLGRAQRLLVAVVADHGEGLGDHGENTHGSFLYRPTMNIPFLLWGPSFGIRPAVIDAPVGIGDVAPTLLELNGVAPLPHHDGLSLAAAVTGRGALPAGRGVFAESHIQQIEFGWSGMRAIVREGHKYIDAPRPELYALTDTAEAKDLAGADAERARTQASALDQLVRAAAALGIGHAEATSSDEQSEALRGLGYLASGARPIEGRPLVDRTATDPKDRVAFLQRFHEALTMRLVDRNAEALATFRDLLKTEPRNHGLLFEYGQSLIMARKLDEALAAFTSLVEAHPWSGMGWHRLGQLYDNRRDAKQAEACYRRAISVDRYNTSPVKALGSMLGEQGRVSEAIALLEHAKNLDPSDPAVARDLARLRGPR